MAVRNIRKQLAGVEDLLLGKGKQDQERSAGIVSITKIDIPAIVETIDELSLVDINKYTTAIVKDIDRGGTFIYIASNLAINNGGTIFNGWTRQAEIPVIVVETIDNLSLIDTVTYSTAIVKDIDRGGTFIYDSSKALENNGGTIFNGWTRQYDGAVNVKWFGARGDGVTDDKDAIQKALYLIQTIQDTSSSWYSDKVDSILLFPSGTYKINGTVLTIGNVRMVGDGATIISDNDATTPVFETAYISGGLWISNATIPVNELLADAVTNLKFENLNFKGISYVFKLRGAIWQGHIKNCSFYYCGVVITTNNCFYFNYLDIMVFGTKGSDFENVAKFQLSEDVNRISFDRVSMSSISISGAEGGTGISIKGVGANLSITNSSFELMNTAIEFTNKFYDFRLESTYFENLETIIKDTDGAIKRGFYIDVPSGYGVSALINGSGYRNTVIKAYQDRMPGMEIHRGVVRLNAGTNGNRGTIVYMDSSYNNSINTAKYLVTPDVELIPCDYQLIHNSNANGTYSKYPDGTLIQHISKVIEYTANTNTIVTLPIPFKDPNFAISFKLTPYDGYDSDIVFGNNGNSSFSLRSKNTYDENYFNITAIGRWK